MKTYKNILVALGITLFLLTVGMKGEAEAQPCTVLKDTLNIGGCPYEIDVCVYCGLSYPGYAEIKGIRPIDPNCTSTLPFYQVMQQAYTQLTNVATIWLDYCQPLLPPCEGTIRKPFKWRIALCWYARLEFSKPGPNNDRHLIMPCEDSPYCEVEYEYCVDEYGMVHHTEDTSIILIEPNCTLEGYEVILPDDFIGNLPGDESDCFILHTPCNP